MTNREKLHELINKWERNIPLVDYLIAKGVVVPVVRCGECKYDGSSECPLLSMMEYTEVDGYCYLGERRG